MGISVARENDVVTGICNGPGHPANREFTGTWLAGSDTVKADGLGVIRVGDVGVTDCDHHFVATAGSDIATADGLAVHRVGDPVEVIEGGNGTTITGSDTVTTD